MQNVVIDMLIRFGRRWDGVCVCPHPHSKRQVPEWH